MIEIENQSLIEIGTRVQVDKNILGILIGFSVHANHYVRYEVGWWDGARYETRWFESWQVKIAPEVPADFSKIGFVEPLPGRM